MNRRTFIAGLAAVACAPPLQAQTPNFIGIYTRGYSNDRSCANTHETTLTVAKVRNGMRKEFSLPLEGDARGAEAQPLFVPGLVTEDGVTHNAVIVCSQNNLIYCFDADNSAILWTQKIATPVTSNSSIDMWGIADHWGIVSTPVIDPETNILYCVAWSSPVGTPGAAQHAIHAINLKDGTRARTALSLTSLTYDAGNGVPLQKWGVAMRKQRCSLLLTKISGVKTIFFAAGSVFEVAEGASGWIVAYDIASSTLTALATAPRYFGAGIWMGGQGLASDDQGGVFGVTGNGGFDGITDFSECYFRVKYTPPTPSRDATLKIDDWWSGFSDSSRLGGNPANPESETIPAALRSRITGMNKTTPVNAMASMNMAMTGHAMPNNAFNDQDLGSSGFNIIPELGIGFGSGKDGILYVVNLANMGKTKPNDFLNPAGNYAKLKQAPLWYTFFPGVGVNAAPNDATRLNQYAMWQDRTHHLHGTSVVWKSSKGYRAFCCGENGNVRAWAIDQNGLFTYLGCSAEYASSGISTAPGGMPGGMMSLSSNGTNDAVLWVCMPLGDANRTVTQGRLYAYDAENFGKYADGSGAMQLLWASGLFSFNKFNPPIVNGGDVYVPTYDGKIDKYTL